MAQNIPFVGMPHFVYTFIIWIRILPELEISSASTDGAELVIGISKWKGFPDSFITLLGNRDYKQKLNLLITFPKQNLPGAIRMMEVGTEDIGALSLWNSITIVSVNLKR